MLQFINFLLICAIMLGLYVGYSRNAVRHKYMLCGRHICSGAYAINVECVHTNVPGLIVLCSEFIWVIFVASYVHLK